VQPAPAAGSETWLHAQSGDGAPDAGSQRSEQLLKCHLVATSLLSGKRALITGSSRGIGSCIAVNYAKQGASLILVARSKENLEKVCTAMH